ncbi:ATP-binding protein [Algoriphagus namhaensis]
MRRKLFQNLYAHLSKKEFTILTGARQTGKSTLLRDLESACKLEGVPTVFINLENKSFLESLDSDPLNLLSYLSSTSERTVFFIDEIQYLKDPSNFLKLIFDEHHQRIKIVASGSSAFYLDDQFRDSLAGRKRVFQLLTCDFEDFLLLQGKGELWSEVEKIRSSASYRSPQIAQLRLEWESFSIFGGYPRVVTETDIGEKREILKELRDSFVKRDILEAGVQNEIVFYQLFRILAEQSGQLVNLNELSNTLRVRSETIQNYLRILQVCFHITLVRPFFSNLRKELIKMPKAYFLDSGLRNSILNNFQPIHLRGDKGELWEQVFFRHLADQVALDEIRFWRTVDGREVDFVLPLTHPPQAYETKYDGKLIKEARYKSFKENYPTIEFRFQNLQPWSEDFFRRLPWFSDFTSNQ